MDARALRSQQSLRRAVLDLAADQPIGQVTASAICVEADVTRDTFYRHTDSPVDLLAQALGHEISLIFDEVADVAAIGEGERALLEHVHHRAAIYRGAMNPSLAAPVRYNLERAIRLGLERWADSHPHIVPPALSGDATAFGMATAYAAAGTVGAIEEWLRVEESSRVDVERAVDLILAASPEWWLR